MAYRMTHWGVDDETGLPLILDVMEFNPGVSLASAMETAAEIYPDETDAIIWEVMA